MIAFLIYIISLFHLPPTVTAINSNTDDGAPHWFLNSEKQHKKEPPLQRSAVPRSIAATRQILLPQSAGYPVSESAARVCQYVFQRSSAEHQSLSV